MKKNFTAEIKFWKVMKICAIQGMLAMILCGMSVAHNNYAQLLDKRVTFSFQEVSLERALKEIGAVADVKFFYSVDQLDLEEKISFEAVDRTLREVLDELFGPYQIKYKVHEKKSTITLKKQNEEPEPETSLPDEKAPEKVAVTSEPVATITGKVTDATTQQPMAGVNVIVKGTTEGTTTDADGIFIIWAEDKDVLVFSFIGYVTFETPVGGRTAIDVVLEQDIKNLKEVEVNAGYWEVKEWERTGNIVKVTAKDIQGQPVSNPLATLQSRVPGLEITQQNGVPGGSFTVRIRGTNSIGSGNDPLYIIDGVPYTSTTLAMAETSGELLAGGTSPLNYINPSDILSMEVLKDASATAIYGSRGANGVILITTKKGQQGKPRINVNYYNGFSKTAYFVDLLNTQQYIEMRKEAFENYNGIPTISNATDLMVWDTIRYTNWQKELIGGTARTNDAQLSLSGGDKLTQFFIGGGFHKETTVFPGDNSEQRVSTHFSLTDFSPNQKLKTSISISYSKTSSNLLGGDLTGAALKLAPNAPALFDDGGNLNWEHQTWTNPLNYLIKQYEAKTDNLIGNMVVSYMVLPGLDIKTNLGYTNTIMKAITITPNRFYGVPDVAQTYQHSTVFANASFQNWIIEPQANYKKQIGSGVLNILVGTSFLEQVREGSAIMGKGFASEALMKNIGAATDRTSGTNYYSQYRYHAIFGRINYVWNDKYIIDLTGRRDGSSRFGPGRQFANFGAVGAAWIFSREGFAKDLLPVLSFGKLRISYGASGNDQIGDYEYLNTFTSAPTYMDNPSITPTRLFNADFAWEVNRKFESALEWGLWEDKVRAGVSYYRNHSSNQLIGYPLPPTTGFSSIRSNFPAVVQNYGWEIVINTMNIKTSSFVWRTSFNYSRPRNKLKAFPNLENSTAYANTLVVGQPLSISKYYHYQGLNAETGVYQIEDLDGNGAYNILDRQTISFLGTYYYGGLQNSLNYKGFQLDFSFQFVKQTKRNFLPGAPGIMTNQHNSVMNRWQNPGDITSVQKFTAQSNDASQFFSRYALSDQSVVDASFVRLKNFSFSYLIQNEILKKIGMQNIRVFILGQNLLTFTQYIGLDPESSSSSLPPLRTLTGGIDLIF